MRFLLEGTASWEAVSDGLCVQDTSLLVITTPRGVKFLGLSFSMK